MNDSSPSTNIPGYKRIDERVLQRGDIVLTTSNGLVSKVIRGFTRSDISHAMVCVAYGSVIDATDDGVHSRNVQREFFDTGCALYIMRLRAGIPANALDELCNFVRRIVGTEYSKSEAMLAPIGSENWTAKQFCSRLVAQAFDHVGIQLVKDANYCSPAQLKDSSLLTSVPNPTVPVTANDLDLGRDLAKAMRDATNVLFEGARLKDRSIQDFDDLNRYVATYPQDDTELTALLHSSGYLSIRHEARIAWPWQYDVTLLNQLPDDFAEVWCCRAVVEEGNSGQNRFTESRATLAMLAAQYRLAFFFHMVELYELLVQDQKERLSVARQWLESRSLS